jgi:hypothetical protein
MRLSRDQNKRIRLVYKRHKQSARHDPLFSAAFSAVVARHSE